MNALDVSILIPFDSSDPARRAACDYMRAWYAEHFPEVDRSTGGCGLTASGAWSKGRAVDDLVTWSDDLDDDDEVGRLGSVLVIADCDVLVPSEALVRSIEAVEAGAAWSQPHETVYRLSRTFTERLYRGEITDLTPRWLPPRALERRPHRGPDGGGIVVCTREAYDRVGGIDPRFTDWGGEDISFARALDTLAGPCVRYDAPMWHLWHPRADRLPGNRAHPANEQLANRYLDAEGDPVEMRDLIGSR